MRLFKYLHPDRIDILINQSIRFTQPKYLNDPFDILPYIPRFANHHFFNALVDTLKETLESTDSSGLIKSIKRLLKKNLILKNDVLFSESSFSEITNIINEIPRKMIYDDSILDTFRRFFCEPIEDFKMTNQLREFIDRNFGILSLSQKNDEILMWSHYANGHSGYVIEFDFNNPLLKYPDAIFDSMQIPKEVSYYTDKPIVTILSLNKKKEFEWDKSLTDIFFAKDNSWLYEAEFRLVRPLNQCVFYAEKPELDVYLFPFNPSAILNIYLGAKVSPDFESKLLKVLSQEEYAHVGLFSTKIHSQEHKINFQPHSTRPHGPAPLR